MAAGKRCSETTYRAHQKTFPQSLGISSRRAGVQGNDYRGTPQEEWAEIALYQAWSLAPGPGQRIWLKPPIC